MSYTCARCRRPLLKPVIVDGKGYGKRCAALEGDLLSQPQRRADATPPRKKRTDTRQPALFTLEAS